MDLLRYWREQPPAHLLLARLAGWEPPAPFRLTTPDELAGLRAQVGG